jgi:hypothetical protein
MLNLATLLQIQTTIGLEWLIGTAAILTTGILTSWIDMKMKMARLEERQEHLHEKFEEEKIGNKALFEKIDVKLDKILENQGEVKVQLERKEDKK